MDKLISRVCLLMSITQVYFTQVREAALQTGRLSSGTMGLEAASTGCSWTQILESLLARCHIPWGLGCSGVCTAGVKSVKLYEINNLEIFYCIGRVFARFP